MLLLCELVAGAYLLPHPSSLSPLSARPLGSRWKALAIATASGLSEPLGALLALLFVKPFLTEQRLQYILAFVGGIMMAVCVLELLPEARKCRSDRRLVAGVLVGAAVMGWTLYIGV